MEAPLSFHRITRYGVESASIASEMLSPLGRQPVAGGGAAWRRNPRGTEQRRNKSPVRVDRKRGMSFCDGNGGVSLKCNLKSRTFCRPYGLPFFITTAVPAVISLSAQRIISLESQAGISLPARAMSPAGAARHYFQPSF